jgi:hypothetical protein
VLESSSRALPRSEESRGGLDGTQENEMADDNETPLLGKITDEELESEEWNTERDRLEVAAREATLALLVHTKCRACALPFIYNGMAMIVAVGLPVDVLSTTIESMKMFVKKHENDMIGALSVLTGDIIARDDDNDEEEVETAH